jgi:class 3 adenylate cyclase/tetratricopeptide (TPR) repeat protein
VSGPVDPTTDLRPFVPRLLVSWFRDAPDTSVREIEGSLAFVDISGFTKMTERLARHGKIGAEEMNDLLDRCFSRLLAVAFDDGAELVKWGGDAVLLLFEGSQHEARSARAAYRMRATLRNLGKLSSTAGLVSLRMSVGIHAGSFVFFLVGGSHRELLICGPAATKTVEMESAAAAGEIVVSTETATGLDPSALGTRKGDGYLLRREPEVPGWFDVSPPDATDVDLSVALSPTVRTHLLSGLVEPEHRSIAVAFVEISGVDELLARSGAGGAAMALDATVRIVQDACERHGVTFLESDVAADGAKLLLIAGAPSSTGRDDDAMILAMREVMDVAHVPNLRIGINTGSVFVAVFGPPFRRTYSIKGDAVNLAARVMGKAAHGQMLATQAAVERCRVGLDLDPLEPFMVKGKARPVHAFSVGAAGRSVLIEHDETPLIGREREMVALLEHLHAAVERRGSIVDLVGEPGIGKSRLVDELTGHAGALTVLITRCESYESATPYFPFRTLLREILGVPDDVDHEHVSHRLVDRVAANAPELVPWLPLLAIPLDVWVPPTPEVEKLDEEFVRARMADVLDRFLELVLPTPALIVFDDVHWMDDASSDLLRRLAGSIAERPWMICLTRRKQDAGFHLPDGVRAVTLAIEPLDLERASRFVETATDDTPLPPHVMAALAERSGGNPLFLRELVAAARRDEGVEALPHTVEELMAAQIDGLSPADRALLRYAAVLGTGFEAGMVRAMLIDDGWWVEDDVWSRLEAFIGDGPDGTKRFRHALARDAAYEGLPYRRRRELHRRIGTALELEHGPAAEEHSELLALHFDAAQDFARAWKYSRLAGERAQEKFALVEAGSFYRRAIEAAKAMRLPASDEVASVYEALGDVAERLGAYAEATSGFRAARRLYCGAPVADARLSLKEARIQEAAGRYVNAVRWVRRGERSLARLATKEAKRQQAQLTVWLAVLRQSQGKHTEAIAACERAIELAQAAGDRDALAHAYYIMDWTLFDLGQPEKAQFSGRALDIYRELGDLSGQAVVYNNLGAWAYYRGRWREALEYYEKGRAAREKTGDAVSAAMGTSNIGEILSDQGRLEEAEPRFREALRVWRAAGFRAGVADATIHLGRVASRAGRFDEAVALFEEARAEYVDVGAGSLVLETDARMAECLLFQGKPSEVLRIVSDALARAEAMGGMGAQVAMLHRLRGYAFAQRGEYERASDALDRSLEIARARDAEFELALTLRAKCDIAAVTGDPSAPACEEESEAIFSRLDVVRVPAVPLPRRAAMAAGRG